MILPYEEDLQQPELVIGGSYSHSFKIPFIYSEVFSSITIGYFQGTTQILVKSPAEILEYKEFNNSYLTFKLSVDETNLFSHTLRDTYCQLKLVTLQGETYFNDYQEILVKPNFFKTNKTEVEDPVDENFNN